jgi:proline dehydrogenase
MKISNVSKIIITACLLSATVPQLIAGCGYNHNSNQNSQSQMRINTAVDNATEAYTEAKEMLAVMEEEKGADKEKNALYEQAKTLFSELKSEYDNTIDKAEKCTTRTSDKLNTVYGVFEYNVQVSYDSKSVAETEKLSNNVLNLYQKMRILHCKFMNPNDESCSQISQYQQHMENVFNNPQDTINDNTQNVINNSINSGGVVGGGGGSGGYTPPI